MSDVLDRPVPLRRDPNHEVDWRLKASAVRQRPACGSHGGRRVAPAVAQEGQEPAATWQVGDQVLAFRPTRTGVKRSAKLTFSWQDRTGSRRRIIPRVIWSTSPRVTRTTSTHG